MAHRAEPDVAAPSPRAWAPHLRASLSGMDHASIMGMELVAAILTWAGIGWLLDRWLGTTPWLLVVGGLVGNAAGLYLIWLRSARMQQEEDRRAQELGRELGPAEDAGRTGRA